MGVRTMGVEEELLLVDPETGELRPSSQRALAVHRERSDDADSDDGADIGHEPFLHQVETATKPCESADELHADLIARRRDAATAAAEGGSAIVATGTPVLPYDDRRVTPKDRYQRIAREFGAIGRQA